ncbi:MAG: TonB-dependent receptor, partial [Proteobacteria bacterium]|nr:TonB-dependent receptor [Pseudomonadota bacterium]
MNTPKLFIVTWLLTFASPSLLAADISVSDTIIVSATRTEIPLDDAIVPVKVITRADIELSLATDLAELLRFEAGIDIGRNGGPGQATSIFLRGTESNHTLVLIDGVRINPGTLGGAAVQHIAPEMIERIEIVKGARSALYGTDAIGGVINIITRQADSPYVEAGLGTGSFNSQTGHVSAGTRGDAGEFSASINWQDSDGYA